MRWRSKQLGEIAYTTDYVSNGSFASLKANVTYQYQKSFAILLRTTDYVKNWKKDFVYVDESSFNFLKKSTVEVGDLVISNVGNPGIVFLAPDLGQPMTMGPNAILIRCNENCTNAFLLRLFQAPIGRKMISAITTGTTQLKFNKTNLRALNIPIPPLEEQERIVEVLDEAFAAIDKAKANIERNLTNARELFQSRLNDIFSNPSEDWEVRPLGEIAKRVCVGHVGSTSKYYVDEGGVPFFRTGDLRNEYLSLPASKSIQAEFHEKLVKSQLNANDLVISRVISERVICSIVPSGIAQANCANVVIAKIGDEQSAKFLSAQLSSKNSQDYFLGNKVGSAQQVVNTKILSAWPVLWPPHDEQKKIITELDTFRDLRKTLEVHYQTELDNLEELRQSILEQAFEGKLTEPVAA